MGQMLKTWLCPILTIILLSINYHATTWSQVNQIRQPESMTQKDINTVLKDHDKELLAIPGVVGVYIGLLPDNTTLCLKVMVIKEPKELKRMIHNLSMGIRFSSRNQESFDHFKVTYTISSTQY